MQPRTQYLLLALLRFVLALTAWGVVHPDELFQSVEVRHAARPRPLRDPKLRGRCAPAGCITPTTCSPGSSKPPTPAAAASPLLSPPARHCGSSLRLPPPPPAPPRLNPLAQLQQLAAYAGLGFTVGGWAFFLVSRLWMACASFLLDYSLLLLLRRTNPAHALRHLLMFASSWPVLVFCTRPFSNTLEAIAVALVLLLVSSPGTGTVGRASSLALAACAVVGVWIRVTTLAFLAPSALYHFARLLKARQFALLLHSVAAIALTAAALVLIDTRFYAAHSNSTAITVTPWNLFLYNSNTENLATHGLHPRMTHAAVNVPMLLTAAAPALYHKLFASVRHLARREMSWFHLDALLASTLILGIAALSLFPHQEPRFLLPLLVPSIALLSSSGAFSSRRMRYAWTAMNAVLLLFWGGVHQAALIPVLHTLSSRASGCSIVVAGTYSAPASAVARCVSVGNCSSVPVASLEGSSVSDIDAFLSASVRRGCVFLAAPAAHPL
jgi:phosphatidylinositol glycan class Z